jgi:hypothetical protein
MLSETPAPSPPLAAEPALLTVSFNGQAYLNREASRVLPADMQQLRLTAPTTVGGHWWLLPNVTGAPVHRRADRIGYLRFNASQLATQAFAAYPRGIKLLHFELRPVGGGFYQLHIFLPNADKC